MLRRITYIYLAILIYDNKSNSLTSGLSMEDTLDTGQNTRLLMPKRLKIKEKDKYDMPTDYRIHNRELDLFSDNFNSYRKEMKLRRSKLNLHKHRFQNRPKNTTRSGIRNHPSLSHERQYFSVETPKAYTIEKLERKCEHRGERKRKREHQSHIPNATKSIPTHTVGDLEPEPETHKPKRKHVEPLPAVTDERDVSTWREENFFSKLKKIKKSSEHATSSKLERKLKNEHPRLNKHQKSRHDSSPIQPELNIALKQIQASEEKQLINTNNSNNILNALFADIITTSKTDFTEEAPIVKNRNQKSKRRKDEFTLKISDFSENRFKANDKPFQRPSPLLDIDASIYQQMLQQRPFEQSNISATFKVPQNHKTNNKIFLPIVNKKITMIDNKKTTPHHSMQFLVTNQQTTDIGMFHKNEENYDQPKDMSLSDVKKHHVQETLPAYKIPTFDKVTHAKPFRMGNKINNYKPTTVKQMQPKVAKKKFENPFYTDYKNDEPVEEKKEVEQKDDFSKAELGLTNRDQSDDKSESNESDNDDLKATKEYLRRSRKKCQGKKAIKKCRKACSGAYKSVCRRLKCSPKAKRDLKYQCKKSCRSSFK